MRRCFLCEQVIGPREPYSFQMALDDAGRPQPLPHHTACYMHTVVGEVAATILTHMAEPEREPARLHVRGVADGNLREQLKRLARVVLADLAQET